MNGTEVNSLHRSNHKRSIDFIEKSSIQIHGASREEQYIARVLAGDIYSYNTEGPRAISCTKLPPTRRGGYGLYTLTLAGASGQHGPACAKSADYRSVEE